MKYYSMKLLIVLLIAACSTPDDNSQEKQVQDTNIITVSGTVGYPQDGIIVLEKIEENQAVPQDTLTLNESNQFEVKVNVDDPGYYRLNFYNKQLVMLILENDNVVVNVDGNNRTGFVSIEGSTAHDLINEIQDMQRSLQNDDDFRDINQRYNEAVKEGNKELQEAIQEEYLEFEKKRNEKVVTLIDSAGPSLAVVDILSSGRVLNKDEYFDFYDRKARELSEALPENERVLAFNEMVDKMRVTAVGQVAPEIALPNPEGDTVKLSSLRGNYVLLDFWAKWCKPCRMENPNVVRMYQKYNDKGFEVFGVSLDRNKQDWLQAIEEDNLTWTHVSDLKYWNSEAAKTYGVNAIPFALLLNPEGEIIAKNLRGQALERKLEEIFSE